MLIPSVTAIIATFLLIIVRSVVLMILRRWAQITDTKIDDIILKSFRIPSIYWAIAIGLYVGAAVSELPVRYIFYFNKTIHVIVILSITIAAANLAGKIFRNYIQESNLPIPTTGLAYGILKGTIIIIGILASIAAPLMRGFKTKAICTEAVTAMGAIRSAAMMYHSIYGAWPLQDESFHALSAIPDSRFSQLFPGLGSAGDLHGVYFGETCYQIESHPEGIDIFCYIGQGYTNNGERASETAGILGSQDTYGFFYWDESTKKMLQHNIPDSGLAST